MVFRKPYAFFIKSFKKIHLVLILLCAFIYSRTLQLRSFNNDFLTYQSYDSFFEPISKYLSPLLYLALSAVIVSFLILLIILKRKNKPWKLYLVPIFTYLGLLVTFLYTSGFYNSYNGGFATTTVRAINNFVSIFLFPQYAVFIILIVRVLGLDIKNFNFAADEEVLDLDQDDREEFEVSVNFDKYALKRNIKRFKRNLIYIYEEHKFLCNIIFTVVAVISLYRIYYYFGVTHKTVKENKTVSINGYDLTINKSFYTNRDKAGRVIEKNSAFVILNVTVVNNGASRVFDGNDFHIVNGAKNYTFQGNSYSSMFKDIGEEYPIGKIKHGGKRNFALIFKVDKDLNYKKFILYYQEYRGRTSYLRKIKLKLNDVSKIEDVSTKSIGKEIVVNNAIGEDTSFTFEKMSLVDIASYNVEVCGSDGRCSITARNISVSKNYKIMYVEFSSLDYEGTELIDFSKEYGKIKYIDSEGFAKEIKIEDAASNKDYLGKFLYIKVPANLEQMSSVELIFTVRNRRYIYRIK